MKKAPKKETLAMKAIPKTRVKALPKAASALDSLTRELREAEATLKQLETLQEGIKMKTVSLRRHANTLEESINILLEGETDGHRGCKTN